jgi:site-specific recombinase XerD
VHRFHVPELVAVHVGAKLPSPNDAIEVTEVMRGIRRNWKKPAEKKAAAVDEEVKRLVDAVEPQTLKGLRDRALVLVGFAGAFRRSELVALDVAHLTRVPDEGIVVAIPSSKTDQEGQGQVVSIASVEHSPYCPVQAIDDWLIAADITSGAVFRRMHRGDTVSQARLTAQSVALVIKELALEAGLDPTRYAGHSLRSGFTTSAARNGANIFKIAAQTRHKKLDTVRGYVRDAELFEDHAANGLLQPHRDR